MKTVMEIMLNCVLLLSTMYICDASKESTPHAKDTIHKISAIDVFFNIKVGMARPAARRLLDLMKKKRRKAMMGRFLPGPWQQKFGTAKKNKNFGEEGAIGAINAQSLTCLIHNKDITLQGT